MSVLVVSLLIVLSDQASKLLVRGVQIPALGISWQGDTVRYKCADSWGLLSA